MTSFVPYANTYANFWEMEDKPCHEILSSKNFPCEQRLQKLARAIWFYRIFWRLRKEFDEGKGRQRYEPILKLLDGETSGLAHDASPREIADRVLEFEEKIKSVYTDGGNLSAASKFLWLKFRHPFIIYDERARATLNTKRYDIHAYYEKWRTEYARHENASQRASEKYFNEDWFQGRIFDNYLWSKAGK